MVGLLGVLNIPTNSIDAANVHFFACQGHLKKTLAEASSNSDSYIFIVILNYLMAKALDLFNNKAIIYYVLLGLYLSALVYSFCLFAPLT